MAKRKKVDRLPRPRRIARGRIANVRFVLGVLDSEAKHGVEVDDLAKRCEERFARKARTEMEPGASASEWLAAVIKILAILLPLFVSDDGDEPESDVDTVAADEPDAFEAEPVA